MPRSEQLAAIRKLLSAAAAAGGRAGGAAGAGREGLHVGQSCSSIAAGNSPTLRQAASDVQAAQGDRGGGLGLSEPQGQLSGDPVQRRQHARRPGDS